MTFSIALRTVPERSFLFSSLMRQLVQETALSEGAVRGIHVSRRPDVTPNENACLALEAALQDRAEWTLFIEDDAGPIDDFLGSVDRWLAKYQREDIHIYPLGCQYSHAWPKIGDAWEYPISKFYCSVAMVIRAVFIPSLLVYIRSHEARQGFDLMSGRWHQTVSSSPFLLTPMPCFIEHLGDQSTLIDGRSERNVVGRFAGFAGREYVYRG